MKLPVPNPFQKKKSSSVHYLALLLRDEKAVAIIIEEVQGTVKVIGRHEEKLPSPLENFEYEELLSVLDKTISSAEETLPSSIETENTVFGVKETWVEDKKIKKEYLIKLKKICDELSLKPIGFMVTPEAIAHLIQKEEGLPLSAVLADITDTSVTLSLFRAGKIVQTTSGPINESVPHTVDGLLHNFTIDVLPSRIVLLNENEDNALGQEFIAHHFSKSIPFLHVPQISVLPSGFDGKAMVFGAAEQMGLSASHIFDDLVITDLDQDNKHKSKQKDHEDTEEKTDKIEDDKDSSLTKNEEKDLKSNQDNDDFGFVIGKDVTEVKPSPYSVPEINIQEEPLKSHRSDNLSSVDFAKNMEKSNDQIIDDDKPSILHSSMSKVKSLASFLPSIPFSGASLPRGKLMIIIPAILLLFIALLVLYITKVSAEVTLILEPKGIEKQETVTLSVDGANNFNENILAAKEVEVQLEGSLSMNVTGKEEVGEKAKGTVTLFNNSESKRTVASGTVLTSANNRKFVTDKEVVVASASGSIFSGTKPGTSQVAVTAEKIGNEYNLPSNTEFTISGISNIAAKNDSAFSGGSKKEVTVFSKKDADKLSADLPKSLEEKALDSLEEKLGGEEISLNEFTDITLTKKNFDKDVGDEAKQVTLKATVLFTTFSYNQKDLNELAQTLLKDDFSDDLSLSDKDTKTNLEDIDIENDEEITATLKVSGGLVPNIDNQSVVDQISGKSFIEATEVLRSLPQVKNAEVKLTPNIPFLPQFLPRMKENITVIFKTT